MMDGVRIGITNSNMNSLPCWTSLKSKQDSFSERTAAIVSAFLISFANVGSIGTIVGAVKGLNEKQGNVVARFGLKLLYGASLVSVLSAIIIGIVF